MRSVVLFALLYIGAAIAVSLDVGYISDQPTSYGSSQKSLFGVKVTNDNSGNVAITNVQYFVVPLNFFGIWNAQGNSYFFPGSLHTINPNATGSEGFTILTSTLSSAPVVLVTAFYWKSGTINSVCGTFYLTKTDTYKREVQDAVEIVESREVGVETVQLAARDQYYVIAPAQFQAVVGVQTWNALNFKSNYGNLVSFSYTAACNDPGNTVDIAYQASGTNLGTVGATSYKASSISLMAGYPPNGPGDFWNITVSCQFKIGTNTTYTNTVSVRKFVITDSKKRSADKDEGFSAVTATLSSHSSSFTMRAEYSIAVAVAGCVVAAVAIVAAIVIVRRRPHAVSAL